MDAATEKIPLSWFEDNIKLCYRAIYHFLKTFTYATHHYRMDDFIGLSYMAFMQSRESFDGSRDVKFSSYLYRNIWFHIHRFLASESEVMKRIISRAKKHGDYYGCDPDEKEWLLDFAYCYDRHMRFFRLPNNDYRKVEAMFELFQEDANKLRESLYATLRPRERLVMTETIINGKSFRELGAEWGVSRQMIGILYKRGMRKMRERTNVLEVACDLFNTYGTPGGHKPQAKSFTTATKSRSRRRAGNMHLPPRLREGARDVSSSL